MRTSISGIVLVLGVTLPSVATELGLGFLPCAARVAAAQPADPTTEVARQRYEDGVKAFDGGRYEEARAAFLQAYALKRHPAVLLNLGLSELRANHPEDAGNHLQQFLREHTAASPDQRASAEKAIADAKRKTAFLITIVDANGADISVDGVSIGKAPILDPYFVKPGKHTVFASFAGKNATQQVDAKAGAATAATLNLGVAGAAPAPVAPVPAPGPTIPPPAPSGPPAAPPPGPAAPPTPVAYPPPQDQPAFQGSFGATASPPPDQGVTSGREPFFDWYTRKPLAWVGTGVAAVGLIGGIAFSATTAAAASSADEHSAEIQAHSDQDPQTNFGQSPPCGETDSGESDLADYRTACDALREDLSDHGTNQALAITSWVVFGVGVVGTAVYAMVDWFPKKKASVTAFEPRVLAVVPVIGPEQQGFGLLGTF